MSNFPTNAILTKNLRFIFEIFLQIWKKSSAVNEPLFKFPRIIFKIFEIILAGNFDLALGLCAHARR